MDAILNKRVVVAKKSFYKRFSGRLFQTKFVTRTDIKQDILGVYDKKAFFYYAKKYHTSYEVAKEVLSSTLLVDDVKYEYPRLNELVSIKKEFSPFLKKDYSLRLLYKDVYSLDRITDNYTYKALKDIPVEFGYSENKHIVSYGYKSVHDEVLELANQIIMLVDKGVNPLDIVINKPKEYYIPTIKEIFHYYMIDTDIDHNSLFAYPDIVLLYNELAQKAEKLISEAFDEILLIENPMLNDFVEVLDAYYSLDCNVHEVLPFILDDLKGRSCHVNYRNIIRFVDIDEVDVDVPYFFVIGLNQDVIPKVHKDDAYLSDKELESLGLFKSYELNKNEIINSKNLLSKAYRTSFSLFSLEGNLLPSSLIDEKIMVDYVIPLNKKMLEIEFGKMLDNYYTYGAIDERLGDYATTLNYTSNGKLIKGFYQSYDNNYNGSIQFPDFSLSYTSINKYYECAFHYYIDAVLKVRKPFDKTNIEIGNFFHSHLANLEEETNSINSYYKKRYLQYVEKIKEFNSFDSKYLPLFSEKVVMREVCGHSIKGIIDYALSDGKRIIIVDFKSGEISADLKPMNYGLKMQLPLYMYFLHDEYQFAGIYYQKIIPPTPFKNEENDELSLKKFFRLDGFSNLEYITDFDPSLEHVLGIRMKKDGSVSSYSNNRCLDDEKQGKIIGKIDEKIRECISNIERGNFPINPKIYDLNSCCGLCNNRDICFVKEKNYVVLEKNDWLGEENDSK